MNRFYLILPLVLTVFFGGVYWQHSRGTAEAAALRQAGLENERLAEEARKKEARDKALADADRRAAGRLAEEQKKEAEKKARWEADGRIIAADTEKYRAQHEQAAAELGRLEARLAGLRSLREARAAEVFEQARAVELDRIRKRNAELEIQRLTGILVSKAADSSLARHP